MSGERCGGSAELTDPGLALRTRRALGLTLRIDSDLPLAGEAPSMHGT